MFAALLMTSPPLPRLLFGFAFIFSGPLFETALFSLSTSSYTTFLLTRFCVDASAPLAVDFLPFADDFALFAVDFPPFAVDCPTFAVDFVLFPVADPFAVVFLFLFPFAGSTFDVTPSFASAAPVASFALSSSAEYNGEFNVCAGSSAAVGTSRAFRRFRSCSSRDLRLLYSAHEKQGLNHALSFLHIIVSTHCSDDTKIQDHINTIRTAYERLIAADVAMHLPDQVLAGILLYSFPSSYEPIKMMLFALKYSIWFPNAY